MGTDFAEGVESLPSPRSIKVHRLMCTELIKLVDGILKIFPQIEEARPRCSSGLEALCLLNKGIEKAKSLLQCCSESSVLYLAFTGDAILARCKRSRNLLEQGLCMIQNDVPVMLAVQISQIIADLSDAIFTLDASDVEAGKALKSLLRQNVSERDSKEEFFLENMRFAALRLDITSQRAILAEKRSIRKLLEKLGDGETKKQILFFYLNLLSKYGKSIARQQTENACVQSGDSSQFTSSYNSMEPGTEYVSDMAQMDILKRPTPPEEYKCPISARLMYDPVIIASGQTFERMWIQRWFDEGHNICPKTRVQLAHLLLTPNSAIKCVISKWCKAHGIPLLDPYLLSAHAKSFETSSTSLASLSSSMNDLNLPVDFSSISLGSLDFNHNSDSSDVKMTFGRDYMSMKMDEDSYRYQSFANKNKKDMEFHVVLDGLPWESQCKMVEAVKSNLEHDIQDFQVSSDSFIEQIIKFLKDALDQHDLKALRTGCLLLLALIKKCRNCVSCFKDGAYDLLASLLNSEVTEEALFILELLSQHRCCTPYIATSGALTSLAKILDTQIREFQEPAITILHNLSLHGDIRSLLVSSNFIPKLVPLFEDIDLARYCIAILKNLCDYEDARVSVAETNGCIAFISKILETGNYDEQEYALAILLSLCSQNILYCQLVMDECVIPALVSISNNGNDKGKASAMELLRLLKDVEYTDAQERPISELSISKDTSKPSKEKKHWFWGKMFSKPSSKVPKMKK